MLGKIIMLFLIQNEDKMTFTPIKKKRKGKFKATLRFLETRAINDTIFNVVMYSNETKYFFVTFTTQKAFYDNLKKGEQLIIRFNIATKEYESKAYTTLFITEVIRKADVIQQIAEKTKVESEYTTGSIFSQNHDFDNQ